MEPLLVSLTKTTSKTEHTFAQCSKRNTYLVQVFSVFGKLKKKNFYRDATGIFLCGLLHVIRLKE